MKLKIYLLMILSVVLTNAFSQNAEISFGKTIHDYGKIKEVNGPVAYTFEYTNSGNAPLVIQKVESSCGCTVPEWTQSPVLPGKTGFVKAIYNPAGRPYPFDKTITVISNSSKNNIVVLRIKGNVEGKPITIEDEYPLAVGALRIKGKSIDMGRLKPREAKSSNIEVLNTGKTPIIVNFENVPSHITLTAQPVSIPAGQKGVISCLYNAGKKNDIGPSYENVSIKAGGQKGILKINANVIEDFSKIKKEQSEKAPKIKLNRYDNMLNVKKGETVKNKYEITNEGKSDLVIRKVVSDSDCISSNLSSKTIKPGQKATLELTTETNTLLGEVLFNTTIVSNSPSNNGETVIYTMGEIYN